MPQTPAVQRLVPLGSSGHTLPQVLQFEGSAAVSAQEVPHLLKPESHVKSQVPERQSADPSAGSAQALPQVEQLRGSLCVFTHAPLQLVRAPHDVPHAPWRQTSAASQWAAGYAIQLAKLTRRPTWLEYVFELYTIGPSPLPFELVASLVDAVRATPTFDRGVAAAYLRAARQVAAGFTGGAQQALDKLSREVD